MMKRRIVKSTKLFLVLTAGVFLLLGSADKGGFSVDAGVNQTVTEGENVTLDGSKSTADEGETLIGYKWSEGSVVYCENDAICIVDNLSEGEHYITLTVLQSDGLTAVDTVKVEVKAEEAVNQVPAKVNKVYHPVLKTGQMISYTDFDDGYYQKGASRSYTRDDTKEVVIDNTTGLMWQDDTEVQIVKKNWEFAKHYCPALTLGGYSDWRLPDIRELKSIVDRSKVSPAADLSFQNISDDFYMSSTTYAAYMHNARGVYFNDGQILYRDKKNSGYVRCVRFADNRISIQKPGFVRSSGHTVTDTEKGLMWQDDKDAKRVKKNWSDAIDYCENLTLANHSDWRLPNYNELESMVEYGRNKPAVNQIFHNKRNNHYWSSTTSVHYTNTAWGIYFGNGCCYWYNKSGKHYVRCVRSLDD